MVEPNAPAGWYSDPSGNGQRYWDGSAWSDVPPPLQRPVAATALASAPVPAADSGRITIHYGFALLAIFALLGTVIPTIIMFSAASGTASDTSLDADSASTAAGIGSGMAIMWLLWGGMWTLIWAAFAIHHTLRSRR